MTAGAGRGGKEPPSAYSGVTWQVAGSSPFFEQHGREGIAAMAGVPSDFKGTVNIDVWPDFGEIHVLATAPGVLMRRGLNPGDKTIENLGFSIANNSEYKGRGTELFATQVNAASAAGFTKIVTVAGGPSGGENGYYTWARLGYQPDGGNRAMFEGRWKAHTGKDTDFRDIMATPTGRKWFLANGDSYRGTFDLTPGSESRKTLDNYLAERKIKL